MTSKKFFLKCTIDSLRSFKGDIEAYNERSMDVKFTVEGLDVRVGNNEWITLFNGPQLYDAKYHWTSLR